MRQRQWQHKAKPASTPSPEPPKEVKKWKEYLPCHLHTLMVWFFLGLQTWMYMYSNTEGATHYPIEGFTRFSQCHLWKLMSAFYDQHGVESWRKAIVPHFGTSNMFIANAYANLIQNYMTDAIEHGILDTTETVYIVELGSGAGVFGHYLMQALRRREVGTFVPMSFVNRCLGPSGSTITQHQIRHDRFYETEF